MYSLVEPDTVKSVLQNIEVILTTIKGSDVHRPDFGISAAFLDRPLTELSKGRLKAEIVDAIERWEPRAKVNQIDVRYQLGEVYITLFLEIEGEQVKKDVKLR